MLDVKKIKDIYAIVLLMAGIYFMLLLFLGFGDLVLTWNNWIQNNPNESAYANLAFLLSYSVYSALISLFCGSFCLNFKSSC